MGENTDFTCGKVSIEKAKSRLTTQYTQLFSEVLKPTYTLL